MSRKDEIIAGLVNIRRKILVSISNLPAERQEQVFLGSWSIMDLLAHLVGWDHTNIDAIEDIRAGKVPSVFDRWNPDWAKYNSELVARYKRDNFKQMLDTVEISQQSLIEAVQALPEDDIQRGFGVRSSQDENVTIEWFLQFEIEDEGRHLQQIQQWLD